MAVKRSEVARKVRVKLNNTFEINSLADRYLACEPILFIKDSAVYNDQKGEYVFVGGGSGTTSGDVYLSEIDLEFPINDSPMYSWESVDYNQDLSRFKNNLV